MWFALDGEKSDGREEILPQLKAVLEFADGLEQQLSVDGIQGIAGALGLYRRLRELLDVLPEADIAQRRAEVESVQRWLEGIARGLEELQRLKSVMRA
jgi:hypothetical protein